MQFENPLLFFICALGVFNGFLVSVYFLVFSKQKRTQNLLFGLLLLFLSIRIGKSVYRLFILREDIELLIPQIGLSACFLIGITLFYYLKSSIENRDSIPKFWKIHFSILFLFIVIIGILKPYETNPSFWDWFVWVIYGTWGLYLLASTYLMKIVFVKLFSKSQKCTTAEHWLVAVLMANILIFVAYLIGYYYLYMAGTITFSVVFYGLLIFFISKKNRETIFQDIPEKYGAKKIDEGEAKVLLRQLNSLMQEQELYKNSDVKLQNVAKQIHISTHKLSQLLNDNLGKSFNAYVNDYRIEEAKRLLHEKRNLTLEAIGFEAGFSSKSSFYATFKKTVELTPAEFQKQFL